MVQTLLTTQPNASSIPRWGWRCIGRRGRCSAFLILLGQKAELIDACGADFVHHRNNVAILGASVALHVDSLIETSGQHILDLPGDVVLGDLRILQIDS